MSKSWDTLKTKLDLSTNGRKLIFSKNKNKKPSVKQTVF